MVKRKIIILVFLLLITIGLISTANLLLEFLIDFNDAIFSVLNQSILSILFKHKITFYIVGLILSGITSFLSIKYRSDIGKILYFLVTIGVAGMLNFIIMIISLIV